MFRVRPIVALGAVLLAAGCQSSAQLIASDEATASDVAARRGQVALSCQ